MKKRFRKAFGIIKKHWRKYGMDYKGVWKFEQQTMSRAKKLKVK